MKYARRLATLLLLCALLLSSGSALALDGLFGAMQEPGGVTISQEEYELLEKYKRLEEIYAIIDRIYLFEYDEAELLQGAAQGMMRALGDDYSFYYSPDQMTSENEAMSGEYGGVGIEVFANATDDTITIKRVFYGGPSQRAGLKASDKIIRVNGEEMRAGDINRAVELMRGEIGEALTMTILRDGEVFDVTLARELVTTEIISYELLPDDMAYMRVYYFEGDLKGQFQNALALFQAEGVRGLIIDLRENPGGFVDRAIELCDAFLDDVLIFSTEDRYGRTITTYGREGKWDIPIVVIVDEYSASASEIVVAALQEHGVAKVVGTQTFGKGIMQSVFPFPSDGAGIQLTTDYWLTPDGNKLHEKGVTPDYAVTLDEDAIDDNHQFVREKDNQFQRAVQVLGEMMR